MTQNSEKIKDFVALLGAIGTIVPAIQRLRESLQGARTEVWENWPWYVIPAVVFLMILFWRRDRLVQLLNPRSTVSRRDAFHIGRKYLLGREADIERLLRSLAEWPLVFLVGESGAGKSSLLERGVLPRLKEVPGQFPLLINSWGPDWIEGPREALAQALETALDEPLRKLLGVEGPVAPGDALTAVSRLRSKAMRTPILLFDQVDDYQTRHRDKFLSGPERTLLNAKALAAANPFWREVADLLESGGARCLFTTRSDTKIGLESVRFQEPKVYLLDPLEKSAAADLLMEISKDAVDHPERSFDRLKERLLNDLAADGWVLPIQMQVAFSGLVEMRFLSVGEYERQGGLPGLEALHLESRISAAARAVDVSVTEVRAVLLAMVDRAARKTIPRRNRSLLHVFSGGNLDLVNLLEKLAVRNRIESGGEGVVRSLANLLEKLETDEVVRRRIDPGGEGVVWLLDHDYLSRGLLELERRAQRWTLFLEEAARSYQNTRGLFERWQKLLPPLVQIRLAYERLEGNLTYGNAAAFAGLSTLRFSGWGLVFLLALYGWRQYEAQKEADLLLAALGGISNTNSEREALWELTRVNQRMRHVFLESAFAHEATARSFDDRGGHALHAVLGFREDERRYILEQVVRARCLPDEGAAQPVLKSEIIDACALVVQSIEPPLEDLRRFIPAWLRNASDLGELIEISILTKKYPEFSVLISSRALELIKEGSSSTRDQIKQLLVAEDRRDLAELFLAELRAGRVRSDFGGTSEVWADVMTSAEIEEILAASVTFLESRDDTKAAYCLAVVGPRVGREAAWAMVDFLQEQYSPSAVISFLNSSNIPLAFLESKDVRAMLESYVQQLSTGGNGRVNLSKIVPILKPEDALAVWRFALESLAESQSESIDILIVLANRLSPEGAKIAAEASLMAMKNTDSFDSFLGNAMVLASLGQNIPADVAASAVDLLLRRMDEAKPGEKRLYAAFSGFMGPSIPLEAVDKPVLRIVNELKLLAGDHFDVLALSLAELATKMSDDRVREVAELIIERLDRENPEILLELFSRLRSRLTPAESEGIAKCLRLRIEKAFGSKEFISALAKLDVPEISDLALQEWIEGNRGWGWGKCNEILPLIRDPKDPRVIDLLKWPTCTNEDRNLLISRLDDLVPDASFGTKGADGRYHADIWGKFLPWARRQGFDMEAPPVVPEEIDWKPAASIFR